MTNKAIIPTFFQPKTALYTKKPEDSCSSPRLKRAINSSTSDLQKPVHEFTHENRGFIVVLLVWCFSWISSEILQIDTYF